jgi:hypothetical protein
MLLVVRTRFKTLLRSALGGFEVVCLWLSGLHFEVADCIHLGFRKIA